VLDFPLESSFPFMPFINACQILNLVTETDSISLTLAKSQSESIQNQWVLPIFIIPVNRSGIPPADGLHGIQNQVGSDAPVLISPAPELCHTAGN